MGGPGGAAVYGVAQSRTRLKRLRSSSSMYSKVRLFSHFQLFVTPWTVTYEVPPSMEFSRQEYWSGLPLPSPGDLLDPGIEPGSPVLQADNFTL